MSCFWGCNWELLDVTEYTDTSYGGHVASCCEIFRCTKCGDTKVKRHRGVTKHTLIGYRFPTRNEKLWKESLDTIKELIETYSQNPDKLCTEYYIQYVFEIMLMWCERLPKDQRYETAKEFFGNSVVEEYENRENKEFKSALSVLINEIEHKKD